MAARRRFGRMTSAIVFAAKKRKKVRSSRGNSSASSHPNSPKRGNRRSLDGGRPSESGFLAHVVCSMSSVAASTGTSPEISFGIRKSRVVRRLQLRELSDWMSRNIGPTIPLETAEDVVVRLGDEETIEARLLDTLSACRPQTCS